ncbi:hypothetical protein [Mycolicibacterium septicum]|nr:hypothetical protein [Mycolicibacterium septicum]
MLLRPGEANVPGIDLPDVEAVPEIFTDTFLRAVNTARSAE